MLHAEGLRVAQTTFTQVCCRRRASYAPAGLDLLLRPHLAVEVRQPVFSHHGLLRGFEVGVRVDFRWVWAGLGSTRILGLCGAGLVEDWGGFWVV